jgi:hypothetical protein
MLCYLPAPYPDELLYSVIARYIVHVGVKDPITVVVKIFGRKMIARVGFPGSLDKVSEHTWPVWQMTGADIANKLTLFPYYSHFLPESDTLQCLEILRSNRCTGLPLKLGLNSSTVKVPKLLRFCRTCRENDLLKYGETYWRRTHQLAGVLVCPEHGERLVDTNALMQPSGRKEYIDATLVTAAESDGSDDKLGDEEAAIALKVAIRCRAILTGSILPWPKEDLRLAYRRAAIERGWVEGLIILDHIKIEKAFLMYYGSLLSKLGCEVPPGIDDNWIRIIFREHTRSSFHPVYHALIQVFLESVPVDPERRIRFGFGFWKCPDPNASHKEEFPVRRAAYRKSPEGIKVDAKCGCGLSFTFSRTSDTDPKLPVIDRIREPGLTWQAEVRRLRQYGLSAESIAEKMQLSLDTVKRILNKKQNPNDVSLEQLQLRPDNVNHLYKNKQNPTDVSSEQIHKWRKQWLKLLKKAPNQKLSLSIQKNCTLYTLLHQYDRDWLCSKEARIHSPQRECLKPLNIATNQGRELDLNSDGSLFDQSSRYDRDSFCTNTGNRAEITNIRRIDWPVRDKRWSSKLRAAALKIRSAVPSRQISRTAMIKEAGLDPSILKKLDRLPECRSVFNESTETFDDYRERRLCTKMSKACQPGEPW